MSTATFRYRAEGGQLKEGVLTLEDYKTAQQMGMTTSGFLNAKYSDADPTYGTAFEQGQQSLGIYVQSDPKHGIIASTLADIMDGTVQKRLAGETLARGGSVVAPSQQGTTPASRVFYPETIMQVMNEKLLEDYEPEMQIWERMLSATDYLPTEQFTQPLIDVTAPRSETSRPIAQNALPRTMVSITASEVSRAIRTASIGLQITEQAMMRSSVDLVTTILTQQANGERLTRLWSDINSVVTGNVDAGDSAMTPVAASTYGMAGDGSVNQTGWLKALYDPTRKVMFNSVICSLDDFMAVQNRSGRPQVYDASTSGPNLGNLGSYGLNVEPNLLNWSVGVPNVMLVPDGTIPAGYLLMFDSRYFLRRAVNTSAAYSATESLVLQRSDAFRFDFGEMTYKFLGEAGKVVDLNS